MSSSMREHILVCLSPSPASGKVLQAAVHMAAVFGAELTALYVKTPMHLNPNSAARLRGYIKEAESRGAHIATASGGDVPMQVAAYARAAHVTKIAVGRSGGWRKLLPFQQNLEERLTRLVPELEVYTIPDLLQPNTGGALRKNQKKFSAQSALISLGLLALATLVGLGLKHLGFTDANIITLYIFSVLLTAFLTDGQVYGLVSSVLAVSVFNFLFTEPRFTLQAYDKGYPLTFLIMFLAAALTNSLTARVKRQAQENAQKAFRTEILLTASRNLQQADGVDAILSEMAKQLGKLLSRSVLVYPVREGQLDTPMAFPVGSAVKNLLESCAEESERAVASWTLQHNKRAGAGTMTFPEAKCHYLAVRGRGGVYAVVGIVMEQGDAMADFDQSLMFALLGESGFALEAHKLNETKNALALEARQEQLRANLLRAISHDLRTPLTSISGNADMLLSQRLTLSDDTKRQLYSAIYTDSVWLISLVENLLSLTRMDSNALKLNIKPEIVADVLEEAVAHTARRGGAHDIQIKDTDELLMARMDTPLIVQVLVNLIDNAIKYTPAGTQITLSAKANVDSVEISVADNGKGIPDESKSRLFDMFYTIDTVRSDGRRGLGLGLALCKSIVSAHGGTLQVSDNVPHGAVFTFTLSGEEAGEHE
ncbi:MAG: DUF4118 domain-containing protein [Angelakisella sp.]